MGNIATAFHAAFRQYNTDGVSGSGRHPIGKADCQALGATIEANTDDSIVAQTVADGTTDDTAAIQSCIDANKGKRIIIPANSTFAGVLLSGSTYNSTTVVCNGEVNFLPGGSSPNFGGAYVAIIVQSCSNVTVHLDMNGNRSLMAANEHIFCVGIAGATNYKVIGKCREIRGDGVYVSQANWSSNSAQSVGGYIEIKGYNSAADGRNLVSLISCQGIQVRLWSWDIGGTVNSVNEPGGIDIEPNATYQSVHDFDIDAFVYCSGVVQGPVALVGIEVTGGQRDYNVYDGNMRATIRTTSAAANSGILQRVRRVNFDFDIAGSGSLAPGPEIDASDSCRGIIVGRNMATIVIGFADTVNDMDLKLDLEAYNGGSSGGLTLIDHNRCRVHGSLSQPAAACVAVQFNDNSRGLTPTGNVYELQISDSTGNLTKAYQQRSGHSVTFSNCAVLNGSVIASGLSVANMFDGTFTGLSRINVFGLNQAASIPTTGSWTKGDLVTNTNPVLSGGKTTLGWIRLDTGTGDVLNTDWAPLVVPNS
jgi:hypothetical protein